MSASQRKDHTKPQNDTTRYLEGRVAECMRATQSEDGLDSCPTIKSKMRSQNVILPSVPGLRTWSPTVLLAGLERA